MHSPLADSLNFVSLADPEHRKSSKCWAGRLDDIHFTDESSDENTDSTKETFKRKAIGSPEDSDFGKVLSRKEKKKLKQLLNKSN